MNGVGVAALCHVITQHAQGPGFDSEYQVNMAVLSYRHDPRERGGRAGGKGGAEGGRSRRRRKKRRSRSSLAL